MQKVSTTSMSVLSDFLQGEPSKRGVLCEKSRIHRRRFFQTFYRRVRKTWSFVRNVSNYRRRFFEVFYSESPENVEFCAKSLDSIDVGFLRFFAGESGKRGVWHEMSRIIDVGFISFSHFSFITLVTSLGRRVRRYADHFASLSSLHFGELHEKSRIIVTSVLSVFLTSVLSVWSLHLAGEY